MQLNTKLPMFVYTTNNKATNSTRLKFHTSNQQGNVIAKKLEHVHAYAIMHCDQVYMHSRMDYPVTLESSACHAGIFILGKLCP